MVNFYRRRNQGRKKSKENQTNHPAIINQKLGNSIAVKIYEAASCKYLNTQNLYYKEKKL